MYYPHHLNLILGKKEQMECRSRKEHTTEKETNEWTMSFLLEQAEKTFIGVDAYGFLSVLSLGIGDQQSVHRQVKDHEGLNYRILNQQLKVKSYKHIKQYIRDKQEWIKNLN